MSALSDVLSLMYRQMDVLVRRGFGHPYEVILGYQTWDEIEDEYRSVAIWPTDMVGYRILDCTVLIDKSNAMRCEVRPVFQLDLAAHHPMNYRQHGHGTNPKTCQP